MKTNSFFTKKISLYSVLGFFALIATSCGSYQNSSYYDNDGVYGSNEKPKQKEESRANSGYYKEYFSNLNKDNQQVFTDVEKYSSNDVNNNNNENVSQNQSNYAGWGSNPDNVTVNIYGNNWGWNNSYWGYSGFGGYYGNYWGWNNGWYYPSYGWNSWYGPSWGWNYWYGPSWYGNYGYGYYGNNWGWNNGYLGHNYAYSGGRRNSNFIGEGYGNYYGRRSSTVTGVPRNYNNLVTPRSSVNTSTSPRSSYSNQNYNSPRNYNNTPRTYNNTPRSYNNSNNNSNNTYTSPRSYTPSNINTSPRSYTPSSSNSSPRSYSGGGGGYNGGGGGRSSGGGGGGRR